MRIRDLKIDIIKGLGIILIVLGHTQMVLCDFVNLFHVGLFLIASGYCYKEEYSEKVSGVKVFVLKRIKGLYVPFVLWNVGYLCFRNLFSVIGIYNDSFIGIENAIKQVINIILLRAGEELAGPSWFIRALFILEMLFIITDSIIKKMCKRSYGHFLRWIVAICFLSVGAWLNSRGIELGYNLATVCSAWILYVFGIELKNIIAKKGLEWETSIIRCFVFGISCLILILLSRFGSISYDANNYPNIFFFLLAAMAGWAMTWSFAGLIEQCLPQIGKVFAYIGRQTMNIMFLHLLCFKSVSAICAYVYGLGRGVISAFPVVTNQWWFLYWIVGVGGSIILCCAFEKGYSLIGHSARRYFICLLIIVMLNVYAGGYIMGGVYHGNLEKSKMDFSLIYEEDYYLEHNPDVLSEIGNDSVLLFNHFITYGMDEGQNASEKFDVYYYRECNRDLAEAYGDDLRKYYLHYMIYGFNEERKASKESEKIIYESSLESEIIDEQTLAFHIGCNQELSGEPFFIISLPAYQYEIVDGEVLLTGNFGETVTSYYNCDVRDYLNAKYVLVQRERTGYRIISNDSYVYNAEILCKTNVKRPVTDSKKGLQIADIMAEDGEDVIDDLEMLSPSYPFINLIIEDIMYPGEVKENVITYVYKERNYYFRENVINRYDEVISTLTERNASVTASVLSIRRDGFETLYYPGISMDTGAAFYAINTTTKESTEYLEAFISFMSERYNGTSNERGIIANWIVGNEVNESGTYNYMGEKDILDYLKEYTRTFRIIYNIVKSNIGDANVYVPMEPWWGIGSNNLTYGGKEFLSEFNQMMCSEGDVDWGLAYHAYSFPLSDPKVLNDTEQAIDETGELTLDGYVTTDNENSVTITMENIEVLVNYMHRKELLNRKGEVRSIVLSEQGYTSNSNLYGKCEAQQAASMVYAYYKTEMMEDIDAFIYFLQRDSKSASLGNDYYLFGLEQENENGILEKKLSYEIFQVMDKKESIQELWYIKNILGIESWTEVIPDFDEKLFAGKKEWNSVHGVKKDISLVSVDAIPAQKYTGAECLPALSVYLDGTLLENDIDYDVAYIDNIETGLAKAVIVGLSDFQGVKEVTFIIEL